MNRSAKCLYLYQSEPIVTEVMSEPLLSNVSIQSIYGTCHVESTISYINGHQNKPMTMAVANIFQNLGSQVFNITQA